jgi:hypothetical protein
MLLMDIPFQPGLIRKAVGAGYDAGYAKGQEWDDDDAVADLTDSTS